MDDNTVALALVLDLYRQVLVLRQRVAELEAAQEQPKSE